VRAPRTSRCQGEGCGRSQALLPDYAALEGGAQRRDAPRCVVCREPVPPKQHPGGSPRRHCSDACRRIAWERAHPGRRGWQAALPGESRVERRFRDWIDTEDGRVAEAEVVRRARLLRGRGIRRYGIAAIWEVVRYDSTLGLYYGEAGAWKLDNSFRSLLARRVMECCPDLDGFFETRGLRGRP